MCSFLSGVHYLYWRTEGGGPGEKGEGGGRCMVGGRQGGEVKGYGKQEAQTLMSPPPPHTHTFPHGASHSCLLTSAVVLEKIEFVYCGVDN